MGADWSSRSDRPWRKFQAQDDGYRWIMNDPVNMVLLVLGLFATMSLLLYVLARIDPQTDAAGAGGRHKVQSP